MRQLANRPKETQRHNELARIRVVRTASASARRDDVAARKGRIDKSGELMEGAALLPGVSAVHQGVPAGVVGPPAPPAPPTVADGQLRRSGRRDGRPAA